MSSVITSLTPNQVNDELNKMQLFIKKEAEEKSREIKLKADQEYEIEKTSIVRKEINNIDLNFNNKLKLQSLKQQINKSTVDNKMRLKVLNARDESLLKILDETKEQLSKKISNDKKFYTDILYNLIMESTLRLLEPKVDLRLKKKDVELVEPVIGKLQSEYEEKAKRPIELVISNDFLNDELIGGVIVSDASNKIELDNTLDERLQLLNEEALPAIRLELFGVTETRKFFD